MFKYSLLITLFAVSLCGYGQIKSDMGSVTGRGGLIAPPPVPMSPDFKPMGTQMKPMEQKIQHKAPEINDCFSISPNGPQEVSEVVTDSMSGKARSFTLDVKSVYDAEGREAARRYFGRIRVRSVTVHKDCTRVILEAENFATADWFMVSKASVIVDCDTRKPYFIKDVDKSLVLDNSYALNLTRSSYQQICLVFPRLDSWVTMIDLICPMPDESEIQYMNSGGASQELQKEYNAKIKQ